MYKDEEFEIRGDYGLGYFPKVLFVVVVGCWNVDGIWTPGTGTEGTLGL